MPFPTGKSARPHQSMRCPKKAMVLAGLLCLAVTCSYPQSPARGGTSTSPVHPHSSRPVHSITLTWTESTSGGVTGYNIYRSEGTRRRYTRLNHTPVFGNSYVDRHVRAGQTYRYVARAVGRRNVESADSEGASAMVPSP